MATKKIGKTRYTPISCGTRYWYNLDFNGFKAFMTKTQGDRPKPPAKRILWGQPGYLENITEWNQYYEALNDWNVFRRGYTYIFSDAYDGQCQGNKIAKFIKKHRLGRITSSGRVRNPNSGNMIETWVWTWNGKYAKKAA